MQSDWPRPTCVVWCTASYVRVPDRDTMPVKQKEEINRWDRDSFCLVDFVLFFHSIHAPTEEQPQSTVMKSDKIQLATFCHILFSVRLKLKKHSKNQRTIASVQLACLRSRNDASRNHNKNGLYAKDHWLAEPAHHAVEEGGLAENLTPISRQMKSVNLEKARGGWRGIKFSFFIPHRYLFRRSFLRRDRLLNKRKNQTTPQAVTLQIFLKKPIKTRTKKTKNCTGGFQSAHQFFPSCECVLA